MKRCRMLLAWMIILTLSGLLGTGLASAQRLQIKDVPPDHWAYEAVASRGYLAVYEDGTFDGTRSVDRFTLRQRWPSCSRAWNRKGNGD